MHYTQFVVKFFLQTHQRKLSEDEVWFSLGVQQRIYWRNLVKKLSTFYHELVS